MKQTIRPDLKALVKLFIILSAPFIFYLATTNPGAIFPACLFIFFMVIFIWYGMAVNIVVNNKELEIHSPSCRFIEKLENFRPDISEKFSYKNDENLGLKRRFIGADINKFRVGWFVLKSGEVGFACLTRKRRARALTTRDGVHLLLDPAMAKKVAAMLE